MDFVADQSPVVIAVVAIVLLAIVIPLLRWLLSRSAVAITGVRREGCVLIGLVNSGKTKLFYRLVHDKDMKTHTSMVPNVGTITTEDGKSCSVVDYPGHRRLRQGLWKHIAGAKVVVVAVDSVMIQDTGDEGGNAVAELLRDLLRHKDTRGVAKIIIAATKRDELTSYSAKNVRKLLGSQLGKLLSSQAGAVSAVGKTGLADAEADAANPLIAVSNEVFDFDASSVDFDFVDVAVVDSSDAGKKKFSYSALLDSILAVM